MLTPLIGIDAAHQFPTFDEATSAKGLGVGLAYGLGWGLLGGAVTLSTWEGGTREAILASR